MTSLVLTCLLGLATLLAGQQTPPPADADHGAARVGASSRSGSSSRASRPSGQAPAAAPGAAARRPRQSPKPHRRTTTHRRCKHRIEVTLTGFAPDRRAVEENRDDDGGRQQQRADSIAGSEQLLAQRRCRPHCVPTGESTCRFRCSTCRNPGQRVRNGAHAATLNEAVSVILGTANRCSSLNQRIRGRSEGDVEVTATVVK
jgi:hypothetical protein